MSKKNAAADEVKLERLGGGRGETAWASPKVDCDAAFANVAVGWNGPVRYRFRAAEDEKYTVVLGLCEGHHEEAGKRILDLTLRVAVEGEAHIDLPQGVHQLRLK